MNFLKPNFKKHQHLFLPLILLLIFLVYSQTLKFDFVWDDQSFLNWLSTKNLNSIPSFFKGDLPAEHIGVYRPVRSLLQFFLFQIFNSKPLYYHLFAILIHLATTYLVYIFSIKLTQNKSLSFLSSLFFGLHPIHIEAITWISASTDSAVSIPILLSLIFYINYSKKNKASNLFLALLFSILAIYLNEFALVIPLLLIFYDIGNAYQKQASPKQREGLQNINKKNKFQKIKCYIPFILNNLIYLFIRFQILGIKGRFDYPFQKLIYSILFIPKLLLKYILLLFLPLNLTPNHNLGQNLNAFFYVDKNPNLKLNPPQITNPDIFIPILIISIIIYFAFKTKKKFPLVTFSIFAFFISLSPVLNFIPQSSLFSEKYLYLPSVFFSILLAYFCIALFKGKTPYPGGKKRVYISLFLLSTYYFLLTTSYNKIWQNNITLWTHATTINPTSSSSFTNLGNGYLENNNFDQSIVAYQKAVFLNPYQSPAWTNLGIIYLQKKDYQNAEHNLNNAIKYTSGYYKAYNYLGIVYHQQNNFDKALLNYTMAYTLHPQYPDPYYYSALIFHQKNDLIKAEKFYLQAINLNPNYIDAYYNLGNLYLDLDQINNAKQSFIKALKINPNHSKSQQVLNSLN